MPQGRLPVRRVLKLTFNSILDMPGATGPGGVPPLSPGFQLYLRYAGSGGPARPRGSPGLSSFQFYLRYAYYFLYEVTSKCELLSILS